MCSLKFVQDHFLTIKELSVELVQTCCAWVLKHFLSSTYLSFITQTVNKTCRSLKVIMKQK